jgi:hypothetical protein
MIIIGIFFVSMMVIMDGIRIRNLKEKDTRSVPYRLAQKLARIAAQDSRTKNDLRWLLPAMLLHKGVT